MEEHLHGHEIPPFEKICALINCPTEILERYGIKDSMRRDEILNACLAYLQEQIKKAPLKSKAEVNYSIVAAFIGAPAAIRLIKIANRSRLRIPASRNKRIIEIIGERAEAELRSKAFRKVFNSGKGGSYEIEFRGFRKNPKRSSQKSEKQKTLMPYYPQWMYRKRGVDMPYQVARFMFENNMPTQKEAAKHFCVSPQYIGKCVRSERYLAALRDIASAKDEFKSELIDFLEFLSFEYVHPLPRL